MVDMKDKDKDQDRDKGFRFGLEFTGQLALDIDALARELGLARIDVTRLALREGLPRLKERLVGPVSSETGLVSM